MSRAKSTTWSTASCLSFGVITALFAMMSKLLPDAKIAWRDVWIGAGLTSLLFTIGKFLIGFEKDVLLIANARKLGGRLNGTLNGRIQVGDGPRDRQVVAIIL